MTFSAQYVLLALGPIFAVFIAVEWWYLRQRNHRWPSAHYSLRDTLSNGVLALLHEASDALCASLFIMGIYAAIFEVRIWDIEPSVISFIGLFFLQDFFYYWFHRGSHHIRWMWASHVVHHSSESLNLSTAFRQSLTYPISGMWLFWVPIIWIGFPPEQVVLTVLLSLAYQFFIHTQVVPKLGVLEWVLNTPSHHRVHHAKNTEYIDRNFAGVLIIWDRMFGTFVEENNSIPMVFGITRQIQSHHPLYLTFHEWRDMFRDAMQPNKSIRTRLKHLWGSPNWQPDSHVHNEKTSPITPSASPSDSA